MFYMQQIGKEQATLSCTYSSFRVKVGKKMEWILTVLSDVIFGIRQLSKTVFPKRAVTLGELALSIQGRPFLRNSRIFCCSAISSSVSLDPLLEPALLLMLPVLLLMLFFELRLLMYGASLASAGNVDRDDVVLENVEDDDDDEELEDEIEGPEGPPGPGPVPASMMPGLVPSETCPITATDTKIERKSESVSQPSHYF
jgi:hypothetical protein